MMYTWSDVQRPFLINVILSLPYRKGDGLELNSLERNIPFVISNESRIFTCHI